jgi:mannose/cellobiose epimerase-like protein (N-acyl-D-glucosamine 2-epimerase family)
LLHAVGVLCIDYYEARQRKKRANSWNDCHSRVEVSRDSKQKKNCWDFAHALLELAVWLQAGEDRAIAAGSKAD